jgi:Arc/MetJ family transcription regulator
VVRRTTIELDEELLASAQSVLGQPTMRATVEEALRRAIAGEQQASSRVRNDQIAAMRRAAKRMDLDLLENDEAWR